LEPTLLVLALTTEAAKLRPLLAQRLAQLRLSGGDDPRTSGVQITDEFPPPLPLPSLELAQLPLRSFDAGPHALLLEALTHPPRLLTPRHTRRQTARPADRRRIHASSMHRAEAVGADQLPRRLAGTACTRQRRAFHTPSKR
jgi:hypothetical protein